MERSFEFGCLMGNPVPVPNPVGMGMGKKSPRLLNGDGDEMALPGGEQTRCHPYLQFTCILDIREHATITIHRYPKP
jgi:hypothetical protein